MKTSITIRSAFLRLGGWLAAAACGASALTSGAADWPQWGGRSQRNMYSSERGLPDAFGQIEFKSDPDEINPEAARNLKWAVRLGSQSYGNVTVAGGRVFVGTNNEPPRDPRHAGDRSILLCLDEKTGAMLWQLVVPKLAAGKVNDWEGLGLLSSPTVEGDCVYLVTSRAEVMCLDVHGMANGNDGPFRDEAQYVVKDIAGASPIEPGPRDADILWVYDMMDELGVFPHNAANGSVLVVDDLLYTGTANGQDWTHANVPFPFAPSLIALDKRTGKLRGADDAGIGPRIFHGQWGSPTFAEVNGRKLVVFGAGDGVCYAFDAKPVETPSGPSLKTVWRFDCNPPDSKRDKQGKPIKYPAAEGASEINATPVFYKNRVYVAVGQDPEAGEGVGILSCVDATRTGDATLAGKVWEYRGIQRSLSTVSIDPETGLLFAADFSGFAHCLDAETGQSHWTHDMKAHMWGSTLVADGRVYVGDEDGDFTVLAASKDKKVISETNLGAAIYGTPVAANGVLYIQSSTHLFAFRLAKGEGGASGRKETVFDRGSPQP